MIEYQKFSLAIALCLCHYSLTNKQINNFNEGSEGQYKIKKTISVINKSPYIPIVKANLKEINTYITLKPRRGEHIGSATRKQYEVINMLWRKTKFFVDFDETPTLKLPFKNNRSISVEVLTTKLPEIKQNNLHQITSKLSSSTPSYIEFYYSDNLDGFLKKKGYVLHSDKKFANPRRGNKILEKLTTEVFRQPVFVFDNHNINEADKDSTNINSAVGEHQNSFGVPQSNYNKNETTEVYSNLNHSQVFATQILTENDINESQWLSLFFSDPLNIRKGQIFTKTDISSEPSTINDKIKFFELYDSNTIAITSDTVSYFQTFDKKNFNNSTSEAKIVHETEIISRSPRYIANKKRDLLNMAFKNFKILQSTSKQRIQASTNTEKHSIWSEHPYSSAYIYEPMSIYCDAAAISAYWLIVSGSCLSRHHKNKFLNERSAYIAYCGDNWWESESIVYVRRSIVHPLYRNRDKKRRHIYNIGVVQVITSLINNCNGWAPVSLVAHKVSVNEEGFPAIALGWGLDRYSGKYSYYNIAKNSLAAHKGTIYPKSCPGNGSYRNVQFDIEFSETNIFCFSSLYKNSSHGSLLLAEGKLIALSLLRRKGLAREGSIQYTGIWRLLPWIQEFTQNASEEFRKSYHKLL